MFLSEALLGHWTFAAQIAEEIVVDLVVDPWGKSGFGRSVRVPENPLHSIVWPYVIREQFRLVPLKETKGRFQTG
jgi:hypothetical protein